MSSSSNSQITPTFCTIKFDFPCGGSVIKRVPMVCKEKFKNDIDFRGKVIQRVAEDFRKEETRKRAQIEHQTEREPERGNARESQREIEREPEREKEREPEREKEREPEKENEKESDREWPDTESIEREWTERELDEIKEKEHAARNERAQEVVVLSDSDSSDVTPTPRSGASGRIIIDGATIHVAPKDMAKRGRKRKAIVRPKPSVKKRGMQITTEAEGNAFYKETTKKEIYVSKTKNKKKEENSNALDIDEDTRAWTIEETECLLSIKEEMMGEFDSVTQPAKVMWQKVAVLMKKEEHGSKSNMDCSVKWRNLKRHFLKLCVPGKDPIITQQRIRWPFFDAMERILENNPTVTLNHVTEVVDSVKQRSTTTPKGNAADAFKRKLLEIEEQRAEALASIAKSQIAKNESFNKIAMAFEALANRK